MSRALSADDLIPEALVDEEEVEDGAPKERSPWKSLRTRTLTSAMRMRASRIRRSRQHSGGKGLSDDLSEETKQLAHSALDAIRGLFK